ncbi:MAG: epoxyqueuosine reductase [bacterium]|nr:epoxyqueuosine reductase [bacterium]
MSLDNELKTELYGKGAGFVYFVDVSQLWEEQNKGYPNAVLLGIPLSPNSIQEISLDNPDYDKEFHQNEDLADSIADYTAEYLTAKGYSAYSQSEDSVYTSGFFVEETKTTPLPHKTIAGLAGLGWIGKHNLLVTPEFGSGICMCTVLTDAPLKTVLHGPLDSQCGNCSICKDICAVKAIKGNAWDIKTSRDELVDVFTCHPCLKCLALCPWTQKYMKKNLKK